MVRVGSFWKSSDMRTFVVRSVETRDDGTWVSYGVVGNDTTYECLVDAFLTRFREHIN